MIEFLTVDDIFFDIKVDDPEADDDLMIPDFFKDREHDQN